MIILSKINYYREKFLQKRNNDHRITGGVGCIGYYNFSCNAPIFKDTRKSSA